MARQFASFILLLVVILFLQEFSKHAARGLRAYKLCVLLCDF